MTTKRQSILEDISGSFGRLKRAMHIYAQEDHEKLGLSPAQIHTLKAIHHLQPVSHKSLARYMQMTPGAISQLLEALDDASCIVRITDESDRRVSYLSVSRKGKQLIQQFHKMYGQLLTKALTDVSDEELETYARVQKSMTDWLESQTRKED